MVVTKSNLAEIIQLLEIFDEVQFSPTGRILAIIKLKLKWGDVTISFLPDEGHLMVYSDSGNIGSRHVGNNEPLTRVSLLLFAGEIMKAAIDDSIEVS